jgi:hypothetical protein
VSEVEQKYLVEQSFWMLLKKKRLNVALALYYNIKDAPTGSGAQWANHCGLLTAGRQQRKSWKGFTEVVKVE